MRDAWSPLLNYAHLSGLLARCGRAGDLRLGAALHAVISKNPTHFRLCPGRASLCHALATWNALVAMYARSGRREDAARVFDEMPVRDSVSWNSLLAASSSSASDALALLRRMLRLAPHAGACDHATLTTVLSACARDDKASLHACAGIHGLAMSCGLDAEVSVRNALVTAYFECESPGSAEQVFRVMAVRNVITWTAMVSGLARAERYQKSLALFRQMRREVDANSTTYLSSLLAHVQRGEASRSMGFS
jgi:pentatricopeptide repeat protein